MSDTQEIHAHIGQVKIGHEGQALHALLGSCIGIGFLWVPQRVYGLAHCLLSSSQAKSFEIGARHVDQAIHSLLELMNIGPDDRRGVHVFLAGGGNMTMPADADPKRLVGKANADFAKKIVREQKLRLCHTDLGGCNARKVVIDCSTGEFSINVIPRLGGAL